MHKLPEDCMNFLVYRPEAEKQFREFISVKLQPAYRKTRFWEFYMYKLRVRW